MKHQQWEFLKCSCDHTTPAIKMFFSVMRSNAQNLLSLISIILLVLIISFLQSIKILELLKCQWCYFHSSVICFCGSLIICLWYSDPSWPMMTSGSFWWPRDLRRPPLHPPKHATMSIYTCFLVLVFDLSLRGCMTAYFC